jgi:hypothetical protein
MRQQKSGGGQTGPGRGFVVWAWVGALFLGILVAALWFLLISSGINFDTDVMPITIVCLFTVVALTATGVAIHGTWRLLRFAPAQLVLAPGDIRVGGTVEGFVGLRRSALPPVVDVRLQCLRYAGPVDALDTPDASVVERSLKGVWESHCTVPVTLASGHAHIPFRFQIPEGLPSSYLPGVNSVRWALPGQVYCQWKLLVSAGTPGAALNSAFSIDVAPQQVPAADGEGIPARAEKLSSATVAGLSPAFVPAPRTGPQPGAALIPSGESGSDWEKQVGGVFLIIFGLLFAGVPVEAGLYVAGHVDAGRTFSCLVGIVLICWGVSLMTWRRSVWLDAERGRIEERFGLFHAGRIRRLPCTTFDRVISAESMAILRRHKRREGGTLVTYHVALMNAAMRQGDALGLGEYSEPARARSAAKRAASAVGLPWYDVISAPMIPVQDIGAEPIPAWRRPSVIMLLLANLVPVGGVLFAGWKVLPLMFLYWLENLILGVVAVMKILSSGRGMFIKRFSHALLCVFPYGMFCAVLGVFVFEFFAPQSGLAPGMIPGPADILAVVQQQGLWTAVLGLTVSHGVSFVDNYLGRGEYRSVSEHSLIRALFVRVFVMSLVVYLGAYLIKDMDAPTTALVMLTALKIVVEVNAHVREHDKLAALPPGPKSADAEENRQPP